MRGVKQIEANTNAGADAELLETRRGAIRERLELSVSYPLVHELQRRKRAKALGGRVENALHQPEVERSVPAHAGGI